MPLFLIDPHFCDDIPTLVKSVNKEKMKDEKSNTYLLD